MEQTEYKPSPIPRPGQARPQPDPGLGPPPAEAPARLALDDDGFAEIEYEFIARRTSSPGSPSGSKSPSPDGGHDAARAYPQALPEALPPQPPDPVRERFYLMRSLAQKNPFGRNDAGVFYQQARFMADFTDDYWDYAEFDMYYPYYQRMGYDQLRTYFTWRAAVRAGDIRPTPESYVFLYIYELLGGIGVDGPVDGLEKLMAVWQALRGYHPSLDGYLPEWLKDYHVYYQLPLDFAGFVNANSLTSHYPELFMLDCRETDRLGLFNSLSGYDITKSKFWESEHQGLWPGCLEYVLGALGQLAYDWEISLDELFQLGIRATSSWYPFARALFYDWLQQPDRTVLLPGGEAYCLAGGRWTSNTVIHSAARRELIGYLLKKTEQCLRQAVGFKYKINVSPGSLTGQFAQRGLAFTQFDQTIEQAVNGYYRESQRTVVNVDFGNLARIREEALGTQDRLIVDAEEQALVMHADQAVSVPAAGPSGQQAVADPAAGLGGLQLAASPGELQPPAASLIGPWQAFAAALSPTERAALGVIIEDAASIKAFADAQSVMLEVLIDGINEKAVDFIGDSILEATDQVRVYDEYLDQAREVSR